MWMVRAERGGVLFETFRDRGIVAIGWDGVPDPGAFRDRDALTRKVQETYPEKSWKTANIDAGTLWRFWHDISLGDSVVTYDRSRRMYLVGRITGTAEHTPANAPQIEELGKSYPNIRPVQWEGEVARDRLQASTRNSLGSIQTLFRLSGDCETDIRATLTGQTAPVADSDLAPNAETDAPQDHTALEEQALELIQDMIVRLDWEQMQELVAGLLRAMGYKTEISSPGADRGKDIVASPDGFGFEAPRIVAEVKHRPGSAMGAPEIRAFLGGRHPVDKGLYVSTGGFTREAAYEAERAQIPLRLMTLEDIVRQILANYEHLDIETQQLVPLKRLWWPFET